MIPGYIPFDFMALLLSEIGFRPKLNYACRHATHAVANGAERLRIRRHRPGEQWPAKYDCWRRKPRLGRGRLCPEIPVVNQNGAAEPLLATSPSPSKPPDGLAWRGHGALGPTFAVVSGRRMTGAVENSSAPTS